MDLEIYFTFDAPLKTIKHFCFSVKKKSIKANFPRGHFVMGVQMESLAFCDFPHGNGGKGGLAPDAPLPAHLHEPIGTR